MNYEQATQLISLLEERVEEQKRTNELLEKIAKNISGIEFSG